MAENMKTAKTIKKHHGDDVNRDMRLLYEGIFEEYVDREKQEFYQMSEKVLRVAEKMTDQDKIDIRVRVEYKELGKEKVVKDILLSNLVKNGFEVPDTADIISLTGRIQLSIAGVRYEAVDDLFNLNLFVAGEEVLYSDYKELADDPDYIVIDLDILEENGLIRVAGDKVLL